MERQWSSNSLILGGTGSAILLLLTFSLSGKIIEKNRIHPGDVVDWDTKLKLEGVWATAYKTNQIESAGDCPEYRDKIVADKSDRDGKFSLTIPAEISDYYVQFCLEGYGGRRIRNKNEPSGKRISPDPIKLAKTGQSSERDQKRRIAQVLDETDKGEIDKSMAAQELAYVRDVDTAGYDTALRNDQNLWAEVKNSGAPYSAPFAKKPQSWLDRVLDQVKRVFWHP